MEEREGLERRKRREGEEMRLSGGGRRDGREEPVLGS